MGRLLVPWRTILSRAAEFFNRGRGSAAFAHNAQLHPERPEKPLNK
jgi:hypothetical protein